MHGARARTLTQTQTQVPSECTKPGHSITKAEIIATQEGEKILEGLVCMIVKIIEGEVGAILLTFYQVDQEWNHSYGLCQHWEMYMRLILRCRRI